MGAVVVSQIQLQKEQFSLAGGADVCKGNFAAPLYADIFECHEHMDVLIDFSVPAAALKALEYCVSHSVPCVIATTGFQNEEKNRIYEASKKIPVFFTGNMSIGVNLQQALVKKTASVLGDSFDVEIVETHHNMKKDAPSGTALMLADAVKGGLSRPAENIFGRHGTDCKRKPEEIGIHSLRGGTMCGEHSVRFLGTDEEVIITHRAYSKTVFAKGALQAASFIVKQSPGLYDMKDLLG